MDPFAAISFAATLLQFAGYARKAYQQVQEIRSNGTTKENQHIKWSVSELDKITDGITGGLGSMEGNLSPAQKQIHELGQECQRLAEHLRQDIEKNTVKEGAGTFAALKAAWPSRSRKAAVNEKLAELNRVQQRLFQALTAHMSDRQMGVESAVLELEEQSRRLEMTCANDLSNAKSEILAAVNQSRQDATSCQANHNKQMQDLAGMIHHWVDRVAQRKREQAVIESLWFEEMLRRKDSIPGAHIGTFDWVHGAGVCYKEWLESENNIFWVTGVPGSGKSTLMKYLSQHSTTQRALEKWAAPNRLATASFYFWHSGLYLQRSQEGLLRSLLFEIFRQYPELISHACPSRWAAADLRHSWSRQELIDVLMKLDLSGGPIKFAFFIDGLDEYQGDEQQMSVDQDNTDVAIHVEQIVRLIQQLSLLPNFKICLSSRPWYAFENAFGHPNPFKLHVQEENWDDIRSYTKDTFVESNTFESSLIATTELHKLVEEVLKHSRGVFLWVVLVLQSLLRGLTNRDRLTELRRRLEATPKTLNGLFERMLTSVEDIYQEQAAKMLILATYANRPLPVMMYYLIGNEQLDSLAADMEAWSINECQTLSEEAEVRIKVRCPDLVKIDVREKWPESAQDMILHSVDFFHRTAKDFLRHESTQTLLRNQLREPFDPNTFLCEGYLLMIKKALKRSDIQITKSRRNMLLFNRFHSLISRMIRIALRSEHETKLPQTKLLDGLDLTLARREGRSSTKIEQASFVGFMARKHMTLYVQEKLPEALNTEYTPLLQCAMATTRLGLHACCGSFICNQTIDVLLSNGADPNTPAVIYNTGEGSKGIIPGTSVWEHFIRELDDKALMFFNANNEWKWWLKAIESCLKHGANCWVDLEKALESRRPSATEKGVEGGPDEDYILALVRELRLESPSSRALFRKDTD